jgi:hypothetical protein
MAGQEQIKRDRRRTTAPTTLPEPRARPRPADPGDRRPARRDRRGPGVQRRGVRRGFRPEGWPVTRDPTAVASPRHTSRPARRRSRVPGDHAPSLLPERPSTAGGYDDRRTARHDHRRRDLRRGRGHGRGPTGHDGQPHREPGDGEGLRRRRVLHGGDRRHRRGGHRAGAALPGRAGALREDRGHADVPRGQGQSARLDDPRQPRHGHAGADSVVPLFAGFDPELRRGRIFSYDVTGGCYEEHDHHSVGSGSLFARGP